MKRDTGKEPRIHMVHAMTVIKFEGTQKCCKEAMGNYIWNFLTSSLDLEHQTNFVQSLNFYACIWIFVHIA